MNPDKISKFIYQLRTEKKLSQYQLADLIPISRQAVSKWERGQTIPDSSTLLRLSEIFQVSINELLKGERLSSNTIEQLEKTTLNIVDENNRKTKRMNQIIKISIIIITSLLLIFLSYYFINSYNSLKVYTINAEGKYANVQEGIFITTKGKMYLKVGDIITKEGYEVETIKLYYQKDKKDIVVFEDNDTGKILITTNGYEEYFSAEDTSHLIKKSYLEITYKDGSNEVLSLDFNRDFFNTEYIFKKTKEGAKTNPNQPITNNVEEMVQKKMQEEGIPYEKAYVLEIDLIRFSYYEDLHELIKEEDKEIKWMYFLDKNIMTCPNGDNKSSKTCEEIIQNDIEKYFKTEK